MTGATLASPDVRDRTEAAALRRAATLFTVAVLIHNGDHLRRGGDSVSSDVFWLGSAAIIVEVAVVALVFAGHRLAPTAAAVAGFQLAVGYLAVHFTPARSWFSDSFVTGDASMVSVAAAGLEATAALVLGIAGTLALRRGANGPSLAAADVVRHPVVLAMIVGNLVIFIGSIATR